jgi:hypothetical protein
MTFTNTDCVGEDIYVDFDGQGHGQLHDQLLRYLVYDEVSWQMYKQIEFIKTKIEQEINK